MVNYSNLIEFMKLVTTAMRTTSRQRGMPQTRNAFASLELG